MFRIWDLKWMRSFSEVCACVWKDESVVEGGTGEMKKQSEEKKDKKKRFL